METLKRKWKICIIHHSHTDIGYTDRQEKIERYHFKFINQAARLQEKYKGFKWVCETFWTVEQFLKKADSKQREAFEEAARAGNIEITANYLNLTELPNKEIVLSAIKRAMNYGKSLGIDIKSAMIADVNGYSRGYANALSENGVENLFACVHSHHGLYPARRKQFPFWWELDNGNKLFVWNAEHYMMGNDLGLVPNGILSYTLNDEMNPQWITEDQLEIAYKRITRYLGRLEQEEYPYDLIPIAAAGLLTDNAPPNAEILNFIKDWNLKFGEQIYIEMSTLTHFFNEIKMKDIDIPVYKGEWPDWWSDGFISTPEATRLFRQAQRNMKLINLLDSEADNINKQLYEQAEYNLMLYAEHTWGHSASVTEPFNQMNNCILARKQAYATEASKISMTLLDDVLEKRGEAELYPWRPFRYKIMNPFDFEVEDFGQLFIDIWEFGLLQKGFRVVDEMTQEELNYQFIQVSRGQIVMVPLKLKPKEERILMIEPTVQQGRNTTQSTTFGGNDRVIDIVPMPEEYELYNKGIVISENHVESEYVNIRWKPGQGIVSWYDKKEGRELILTEDSYGAFTPVYEVTPVDMDSLQAEVRRKMGRNRKGIGVVRSSGELVETRILFKGDVMACIELMYKVQGMKYYSVVLTIYAALPRVDVSLRIQKDCVWEPENIYIALPFTTSERGEILWIDKPDKPMRPRIDQIYGTCADFYTVQNGMAFLSDKAGVIVATPDTPILQVGSLNFGERLLSGNPELEKEKMVTYNWIMSNYWETNFKASVEGFYEFKYSVLWGNEYIEPKESFKKCEAVNTGIVSIRISGTN